MKILMVTLLLSLSLLQPTVADETVPPSSGATSGRWQQLASLLIAVQEIYPVVHQGEIYVAGGISSALPAESAQMTAAVQIYHPASNQWRFGPALPEPRHHAQLLSMGEDLYLFGGFVTAQPATTAQFWRYGNWRASADVLKLAKGAQQWQKIAQLPKPLAETVSFVHDGQIHLVGGRSPAGSENSQWQHHSDQAWHWVFDPVSLQSQPLADLTVAKNSAAVAISHGKAYWLGGRQRDRGNHAGVAVWTDGQWQPQPAMPLPQAGHAAAAIAGDIFVFGGEGAAYSKAHSEADSKARSEAATNGQGLYQQIWRYHSAKQQWQAAGLLQPARHGLGAVSIAQTIYLIGGAEAEGLANTSALVQSWQPVLSTQ